MLFRSFIFCLALVALAAFVKADGNDRICCHHDPSGGDDDNDGNQNERQAWYLYIPSNVDIECHQEIISQTENATPDLTGYAFEANGCHMQVTGCTGTPAGNLGGSAWCFQNTNDDDLSFGLNDFVQPVGDVITPGCGNSFTVTRTWRSGSSCAGNTIGSTQTIRVVDTTAPELNVPDDITVECEPQVNTVAQSNDERFGRATVTDLCNQPATIDESTVVAGDTCTQVITRTFTATDGCLGSADLQVVTIVDTTPPVIEHPPTFIMACEDLPIPTQTVTAHDGCQGTIITATVASDTTYPGACAGDFTVERVYTATDACGNVATHTQVIIVEDNNPPVPNPNYGDIVYIDICDEYYVPPAEPIAIDACSAVSYIDQSDVAAVGGEKETGIYSFVRTYTAADDCGNSISWEQLFTFLDFQFIYVDAPEEVFATPNIPFTVGFFLGDYICPIEGELVVSFSPLEMNFGVGAGVSCTAAGEGSAVCPLTAVTGGAFFEFVLDEDLPERETVVINYQVQLDSPLTQFVLGQQTQTLVRF